MRVCMRSIHARACRCSRKCHMHTITCTIIHASVICTLLRIPLSISISHAHSHIYRYPYQCPYQCPHAHYHIYHYPHTIIHIIAAMHAYTIAFVLFFLTFFSFFSFVGHGRPRTSSAWSRRVRASSRTSRTRPTPWHLSRFSYCRMCSLTAECVLLL